MIKVLNLTPYSCESISRNILVEKEFVKLSHTHFNLCKDRSISDRQDYLNTFSYSNDIAFFIQNIIEASPDIIIAPRFMNRSSYPTIGMFYSFSLGYLYNKEFPNIEDVDLEISTNIDIDIAPIIVTYKIDSNKSITPEMCPYSIYGEYYREESKFTEMIEDMSQSYPKVLGS